MGGALFPPCCLAWDQIMVNVMKIMVISLKTSHACTAALNVPDPTAGYHWPTSPLETTRHSQASLDQSLVGSLLLSPGCAQVLFVLSKSLFPQSCVSSIIKSHWPPKSNSLEFSDPLPDPQIGKSVVGPRTFLTVWEYLWYICLEVCGKSFDCVDHNKLWKIFKR